MSNPFILDYSIKDNFEFHEIVKNDIQKNKYGLNFQTDLQRYRLLKSESGK